MSTELEKIKEEMSGMEIEANDAVEQAWQEGFESGRKEEREKIKNKLEELSSKRFTLKNLDVLLWREIRNILNQLK